MSHSRRPSQNGVNPTLEAGEEYVQRLIHPTRGIRHGRKTAVRFAKEVGLRKVRFFRAQDFVNHLTDLSTEDGAYSDKKLQQLEIEFMGKSASGKTHAPEAIIERLLKEGLISCGVNPANLPANSRYKAMSDGKKEKRWPDRLFRNPNQRKFEKDGFYIINVDERDKYLALKVTMMISGVLFVVMFPAWPFWAKVGLWYFLVLFLFGIIALIIIRLCLFLMLWVAGFEVWIMPNIFDEYLPWYEAFTPVLSVEKNDDDSMTLCIRLFFFVSCSIVISEMGRTWTLEDLASPARTSLDWGSDKLWERYHQEHAMPALPSFEEFERLEKLDEIEEESDDAKKDSKESWIKDA